MFKPRSIVHSFAMGVVAALALSGCGSIKLSPDYQRPALEIPGTLGSVAGGTTAQDMLTWWKGFQDPVLDALLAEAAGKNQDMVLASARITEARASVEQTNANFFPSVDLGLSATRKRASENTSSFSPGSAAISEDRSLGLTASYEADFWGKYARADQAARARLLAQEASRGTVLTTLYSQLAQSYFALRAVDAQVVLAEQTLRTRQENLHLQKRRFEAGVVGELDLRQAESELAGAQGTLLQLRQARSNAESALATLLGRNPTEILRPDLPRGADLGTLYARQNVPANLPSDILNRRPDLVSAEQNLVAAQADIGQARAAYFPRLGLTATLGQQSSDMSKLFEPASLFWNVIGNLTQPVFRAGAIDALVAASNARQQQALAQYTQAVQSAFRDVHDALNNVEAGRELAMSSAQRMEAMRHTLRLANLRYSNGYSGYLEVLNAQRDLAQAESGLIDIQRTQLQAVVSLYKALGGGWDSTTLVTAYSKQ